MVSLGNFCGVSASLLLVLLGNVFPVIAAAEEVQPAAVGLAEYPLNLVNIFVSHGKLSPDFDTNTMDYTVQLVHACDQIAITPEINQTAYGSSEDNMPIVTLKWANHMNHKPESTSIAVRSQIDLPDGGETLTIYIHVANPHKPSSELVYSVTVYQSQSDPLVLLKSLEAVDDVSMPVTIEPLTSQDDVLYDVYVNPDAESFSLRPSCADGNWLTINGRTYANKEVAVISREKSHHRQIVEVACGRRSGLAGSVSKKYILSVFSDFAADDIPPPRIVVSGRGKDCVFDTDKKQYGCPNPKAENYRVRLVAFIEPSIRYTIESSDESVEVRLLDQVPTIPFSYSGVGSIYIKGTAGQHSVTWPLGFTGAPTPGIMRFIGITLGLILAALLLSLLIVLGLSNTLGIGTPIGVTEIASAMTLLLQFFCFASALRGASVLTDMSEAIKWVTLYWPLPWTVDSHNNNAARWGDVAELTNAYGCLFWSSALFVILLIAHAAAVFRLKLFNSDKTFPHRLVFGNWEQRYLHWVAFPVCTAAASILKHPKADLQWQVMAGGMLTLFAAWTLTVFVVVKTSISSKNIVWVWHSSVREDGELEDEAGYWSDIQCDQLLTQPVNRSLFKWFFPWRWVATVADIEPINICPRMFARGDEETEGLYPLNEYHRGHKEASYPLGKNPKIVDILRTAAPNSFCPGQRLIAGLMRTDWIDILFTYQAITRFHAEKRGGSDFVVPVTVKTCQLTGPITGGVNHFFYDGTKIPFIRIGDSIYRMLIGIMLGLSLSSESYSLDIGVYCAIGLLSVALLVYHTIGKPYTRIVENWILGALLFSIAATSFSFMGYSIKRTGISIVADIFLWLNSVTSFLLAAYAALVIFSVYSAVTCPPLEETRFLEKLANCNVTIADHDAGWAVDVPAYNKKGARDLKAQCSISGASKLHVSVYPSGEEPTMEFEAGEMMHACRSGSLRAPVLALFSPDADDALGYRHLNIYERSSVHADVASFLALDRDIRHVADNVARNIAHQVETRGKGKAVVSMTIIPPKNAERARVHGSQRSSISSFGAGSRQRSHARYSSIEMMEK